MIRHWQILRAAETVLQGGVIAYPTEAVFGLGCDPFNQNAVQRILQIKRRSEAKGLIVIASHIEQLTRLISIPSEAIFQEIMQTWPGPFTWILPAHADCPVWLKGDHEGVAVRVTAHPTCRALCDRTGAIVSTSANRAGQAALRNSRDVQLKLGREVDFILPGLTDPTAKPSTIRDALTGERLR